jgi:NTP pyrophosphatase (non-canonical NTP hydrolase)
MTLQQEIHSWAKDKGWWDKERDFLHLVALMHTELSEAAEAWRNNDPALHYVDGKPEGYILELADCIIRIMDTAEFAGLDILDLVNQKMNYNRQRPYRHGDKRA